MDNAFEGKKENDVKYDKIVENQKKIKE